MTIKVELSDELFEMIEREVAYCVKREKKEYEILISDPVVKNKEEHDKHVKIQKQILNKWEKLHSELKKKV